MSEEVGGEQRAQSLLNITSLTLVLVNLCVCVLCASFLLTLLK